jgi:arylsulfatase
VPVPPGSILVPALAGNVNIPHEYLWWFHEGNRAVRVGDWKLVSWGATGPWELFDMSADRSETKNLAEKFPEKVKSLEEFWNAKVTEFKSLVDVRR